MATKTNEQRAARALQVKTLWTYRECLRIVRTMTGAEIDAAVKALLNR